VSALIGMEGFSIGSDSRRGSGLAEATQAAVLFAGRHVCK